MPTQPLTAQEITQIFAQISQIANIAEGEATYDTLSFFKRLAESPALLDPWATELMCLQGEVIFEEGEAGDALYLILSGQMAVITSRLDAPHLLAVRGPGEVIGEMALVEDCPRMASVAALQSTRLLRISQEDFYQLLRAKPEFGLELMRILSGRLRVETRRQTPPLIDVDHRDALTGVRTRASFDTHLREMFEQARQHGRGFSLLLADLDHFKSINDGFGHARGDETLREFTRRAQTTLRKDDLLFRYGGDEFCVLFPDVDETQSTFLAQRLLSAVQETPLPGVPPLTLTLSVGVASLPADAANATTPAALIEIADRRAYQAKRAGRARVVSAAEPEARANNVVASTSEISRLIERDQALESMSVFFDQLKHAGRGGLWISGLAGYGHSRFLREVAANARLRNYAVFNLTGVPALQSQPYGALADVFESQIKDAGVWPSSTNPTPLAEVLALTLPPYVAERQKSGVLIALDNTDWVDSATCSGLQQLLKVPFVFPVGVAYAGANQSMFHDDVYQQKVDLTPLTTQGVQLWLRHSLGWDAPPAYAELLRQTTGGGPAHLQREIAHSIETGALTLTSAGWVLRAAGY